MIRKTVLTALAFATLSTGAFFGQVVSANASGYGYYSQGNGYYYSCRQIRYRYWNGYAYEWRYKKVCW